MPSHAGVQGKPPQPPPLTLLPTIHTPAPAHRGDGRLPPAHCGARTARLLPLLLPSPLLPPACPGDGRGSPAAPTDPAALQGALTWLLGRRRRRGGGALPQPPLPVSPGARHPGCRGPRRCGWRGARGVPQPVSGLQGSSRSHSRVPVDADCRQRGGVGRGMGGGSAGPVTAARDASALPGASAPSTRRTQHLAPAPTNPGVPCCCRAPAPVISRPSNSVLLTLAHAVSASSALVKRTVPKPLQRQAHPQSARRTHYLRAAPTICAPHPLSPGKPPPPAAPAPPPHTGLQAHAARAAAAPVPSCPLHAPRTPPGPPSSQPSAAAILQPAVLCPLPRPACRRGSAAAAAPATPAPPDGIVDHICSLRVPVFKPVLELLPRGGEWQIMHHHLRRGGGRGVQRCGGCAAPCAWGPVAVRCAVPAREGAGPPTLTRWGGLRRQMHRVLQVGQGAA